eukprot:TRINITY_DN3649_c0_g1_i1.p1 TRINITY_DN3649_c0_g1~~TRINITY_DN3649_c0_g1_i1.p1  ORF type:complete len:288 (-),score=27.57 TRINITY_DN3649_c0_g1_i1:102-965(-)
MLAISPLLSVVFHHDQPTVTKVETHLQHEPFQDVPDLNLNEKTPVLVEAEPEDLYEEPSDDDDRWCFNEMDNHCFNSEASYRYVGNRASNKNKKARIHRRYVSVQQTKKEDRRLYNKAIHHIPRPIPELSISYSYLPASSAGFVPSLTSILTPAPSPAPAINNSFERDMRAAIDVSRTEKHESGLSFYQLNDLANRELTPEDYDLLLMLDTTVAKKTTDEATLSNLQEIIVSNDKIGDLCMICMSDYEPGEKITELPCDHCFHPECVGTWLRDHSQSCPLCNTKVVF